MNNDISKFYVLFDDDTTYIILNYIREIIYKKYPYKSLSKSSLLPYFRIEKIETDTEYLTAGNGNKLCVYKCNFAFNIYFKDDFISNLKFPKITMYESRKNKDYLKLRSEQSKKFKS